jgi:hypothetical protein
LCDILLDALEAFGCSGSDLVLEEGEPDERGVACEVDEFDARVALYGDRIEASCTKFVFGTAASIGTILENVWSRLTELNAGTAAKTHSILFEADMRILGASYQQLLNRLAQPPESLPAGTETAIVYYLPGEASRGFAESSLVLNRSDGVEHGLQVSATLVYEAGSLKPAAAVLSAYSRLRELLRNLGLECVED